VSARQDFRAYACSFSSRFQAKPGSENREPPFDFLCAMQVLPAFVTDPPLHYSTEPRQDTFALRQFALFSIRSGSAFPGESWSKSSAALATRNLQRQAALFQFSAQESGRQKLEG